MRCITLGIGCLFTAALLGAQPSPGGRKAQSLIQAAQVKETVHGDLKGAIELYRRAAQEAGSDHTAATRALLALAACYEKQGAAEARKVYEEILARYPSQKDAVAIARRKLGQSDESRTRGPRIRQLWAGPDVDAEGGISPDGRWLTYAHWATGDLGVRDLQNGTFRLLTNTGGWEKSGGQFAEDSIFSPDGKLIAYNWYLDANRNELRLMNADGSGARVLLRMPGAVFPRAWSPDGRTVGVVHFEVDGTRSIHLVSVPSGDARQAVPPTKQRLWDMSLSPDGHWLVFDTAGDSGDRSEDIHIVSLKGGPSARLVENPADDGSPVWSADGKEIYFTSNRGGSYGVWRLPVSGGKASGPASLVKGDLGSFIVPVGFTQSGSFVYEISVGGWDIYELDYDPAGGRATSTPRLVSDRIPGRNFSPSYSPDGRHLLWSVVQPSRRVSLVLRDLMSGEERHHEKRTGGTNAMWSPDSRRIVFDARTGDDPNARTFIEFDAGSAQFTPLLSVRPTRNSLNSCFSADGKTIYYILCEYPTGEYQVYAVDLVARRPRRLLASSRRLSDIRAIPGGRHLAIVRNDDDRDSRSLLSLPIEGGEAQVLATFKSYGGAISSGLAFTPDGKAVIVRTLREWKDRRSDLLHIDLGSGKTTPLGLSLTNILYPDVHPSGRKIVFQAGIGEYEIWVAENILPPVK